MRRTLLYIAFLFAHSLSCYAQTDSDTRTVVGVSQFTSTESKKYAPIVTEKVVEIITNTKRFLVVDRTSLDKVKAELELQKSEAFMDSKNLVGQDVSMAAEKMITGHINKIPVYAIKNSGGGVSGYKCGVSFQMKIVDVETGVSTEAVTFDGKASNLMLSPESAVTAAMQSLQGKIEEYMRINFPVSGKIIKVMIENKGRVQRVLLSVGKLQGISIGDSFRVSSIELIGGEPYPTEIGTIKVDKLAGEAFSECIVDKNAGAVLGNMLASSAEIKCELIIKK